MADQIASFCDASGDGDLSEELAVVNRVYKSCYGGCGESDNGESDNEDW